MSRMKKLAMSGTVVLSLAAMSFGHLPSLNDASLKMGRTGIGGRGRYTYSNRGEWKKTESYKGDYQISQGDTVSHGEFNGNKLWWWAKFAADSLEVPGEFGANGGTSPWVLINSLSAAKNNGVPNYQWKGWNGQMENTTGLKAEVPTWRDGAVGAYSMTHDDIGAMPFDLSVKPAWDLLKNHPDIKGNWGVFVGEMDQEDWDGAVAMMNEGHEMFNHSMRHTSASEQWQWFYPGKRVADHDPSIPKEIRGLTVEGIWKVKGEGIEFTKSSKGAQPFDFDFSGPKHSNIDTGATTNQGNAFVPFTLGSANGNDEEWQNGPNAWATFYNDYLEIDAKVYWTGLDPATEPNVVKAIRTKNGIETITLPTGQKLYVKYTKKDPATEPKHEGVIIASEIGWYDLGPLIGTDDKNDYTNYYNGYYLEHTWNEETQDNTGPGGQVTALDLGRPGFIAKVFCVKGWEGPDYKDNIADANTALNENIMAKIAEGPYFRKGKRSEYFGYPFDAYSETTHDSLEQNGMVGARGGAKSGKPIPGDFFHPYRIDFDAFFITQSDWDETKTGGKYTYPNNPHVLLGLNEMIDKIIDQKGYMIREFHAVADIPAGQWYNSDDPNQWPVNNAGLGEGGWWGGIPAYILDNHYNYLDSKIANHELAVYTVSELTKYRMTANVAGDVTITPNGGNFELEFANPEPIAPKYHEEISVIISLDNPVDKWAAHYETVDDAWGATPRRAPVKMDGEGKHWSISINPYLGKLILEPGKDWNGPTPIGGGSTSNIAKAQAATYQFAGLRNGQVALNLPQGQYTAQLFNAAGRMVSSVNINAAGGFMTTGLRTSNLSTGLYILNVKKAGAAVLQHKLLVR